MATLQDLYEIIYTPEFEFKIRKHKDIWRLILIDKGNSYIHSTEGEDLDSLYCEMYEYLLSLYKACEELDYSEWLMNMRNPFLQEEN